MLFLGIPQPIAIATTTTDQRGYFRFITTKDRGRFLTIRLAGTSPSDFRSPAGYMIENLHDTLAPTSNTDFNFRIVHQAGGGFRSIP